MSLKPRKNQQESKTTSSTHNAFDIESIIIGSVLLDAKCISIVIKNHVHEHMFTDPLYKKMVKVLFKMYKESIPIDLLTFVKTYQGTYGSSDSVAHHASATTNNIGSTANIHTHINILKADYVKRESQKLISKVRIQSVEDPDFDPLTETNKLHDQVHRIITSAFPPNHDVHIGIITEEFDKELQDKLKGIEPKFLSTGFPQLDAVTNGMNKTDLYVVGARPGMGKTAFALSIAHNLAEKNNPVLIFSLEMSKKDLIARLICKKAKINTQMLKNPLSMSTEELERYMDAKRSLSALPIYIFDNARQTIEDIYRVCSQYKDKYKKAQLTIIIDYLQLVEPTNRSAFREAQVSHVSRESKLIAKQFESTVLLLSQLSRSVESRADKIPVLSDLRESGAIEQDADVVCFLYRPAYYGIDKDNSGNDLTKILKVIYAKNRHGSTNTQFVYFDGLTTSVYPSKIKTTILSKPDDDDPIYQEDNDDDDNEFF